MSAIPLKQEELSEIPKASPKLLLLPSPKPAKLASIKYRAAAYLIDILLISFSAALCSTLLLIVYLNIQAQFNLVPLQNRALVEVDFFKNVINVIVFSSYFSLMYWYTNGQTFGKMLFKLQVQHQGQPERELSFLTSFFRGSFGYYISYIPFGLGFILPCFRRDRLALHDIIAKTQVIHKK